MLSPPTVPDVQNKKYQKKNTEMSDYEEINQRKIYRQRQ